MSTLRRSRVPKLNSYVFVPLGVCYNCLLSVPKQVRENRGPELSETICAHGSSRGNQESHARRQDRCMSRELEDIAQKSDVHKTQNGGPHTVLREISAGTEYTDRWLPVDPSPQIDSPPRRNIFLRRIGRI
jgi:hypothetical protein